MNIRAFQRSLAIKARHQPEHQFEHLLRVLSCEDWLTVALDKILSNKGARTAGIDGMTKDDLRDAPRRRREMIAQLSADLRAGRYRPSPVKRVYIPKPGRSEQRPLGIPTITDRIVQEAIRMIMEPIWESKFLHTSYGFRPGRCTMDCILYCYLRIQPYSKHFWVIEGDIRKCFDQVQHEVLLTRIERVMNDHRLLHLCDAILKSGVMEDGLVSPTLEGVPQGGVISPIWTNIYLHDFDLWHWNAYGGLPPATKNRRRRHGLGNAVMLRYADDFVVLTNADHQHAEEMRDEIAEHLAAQHKLQLNLEKTKVTHVTDGFDFLGFHLKYRPYEPANGKGWLQVTPARKSIQRVREKLRDLFSHRRSWYLPEEEAFVAANAIVRGWAYYYRYSNSKRHLATLDWWLHQRVVRWLSDKHKVGKRAIVARYRQRQIRNSYGQPCFRWNLRAGKTWLFQASDVRVVRYRATMSQWTSNPYEAVETDVSEMMEQWPLKEVGLAAISPDEAEWLTRRKEALERDSRTCQECGSKQDVEVHHRKGRKSGGSHDLANLTTLCRDCHQKRTRIQT